MRVWLVLATFLLTGCFHSSPRAPLEGGTLKLDGGEVLELARPVVSSSELLVIGPEVEFTLALPSGAITPDQGLRGDLVAYEELPVEGGHIVIDGESVDIDSGSVIFSNATVWFDGYKFVEGEARLKAGDQEFTGRLDVRAHWWTRVPLVEFQDGEGNRLELCREGEGVLLSLKTPKARGPLRVELAGEDRDWFAARCGNPGSSQPEQLTVERGRYTYQVGLASTWGGARLSIDANKTRDEFDLTTDQLETLTEALEEAADLPPEPPFRASSSYRQASSPRRDTVKRQDIIADPEGPPLSVSGVRLGMTPEDVDGWFGPDQSELPSPYRRAYPGCRVTFGPLVGERVVQVAGQELLQGTTVLVALDDPRAVVHEALGEPARRTALDRLEGDPPITGVRSPGYDRLYRYYLDPEAPVGQVDFEPAPNATVKPVQIELLFEDDRVSRIELSAPVRLPPEQRPDLVPLRLYREGSELCLVYANRGEAGSPYEFEVALDGATSLAKSGLKVPPPGEQAVVRFPGFDPTGRVNVRLDAGNRIPESDDGNNNLPVDL